MADRVILEVNTGQPAALEGMHDVHYGTALPAFRAPIHILHPSDRIGVPCLHCPPEKIVTVVETNARSQHRIQTGRRLLATNRGTPARVPGARGEARARARVTPAPAVRRRQHRQRRPSGTRRRAVPSVSPAYTEVIQDGMLALLNSGTMSTISATAFSLSEEGARDLHAHIGDYHDRIVLRPQEISYHPEVIRRLGCLAMNGPIGGDIYGNVDSTHVMGSSIMNGIGGSGDFARNAYIAMFLTPSTAKNGSISSIVPMVSHVDHTEHGAHVIITEWGVADLRGLAPRRRAQQIIDHCAHPDYRPMLQDYFDRASATAPGKHTPHLPDEALSWHARYLRDVSMQPS